MRGRVPRFRASLGAAWHTNAFHCARNTGPTPRPVAVERGSALIGRHCCATTGGARGPTRYPSAMCRNIRPLRGRTAPPATDGDAQDAARQYVRKIAATRAPAARDAAAFDAAVAEIAAATERLLAAMGAPVVPGPPTPPSEWPPRPARRAPRPSAGQPA